MAVQSEGEVANQYEEIPNLIPSHHETRGFKRLLRTQVHSIRICFSLCVTVSEREYVKTLRITNTQTKEKEKPNSHLSKHTLKARVFHC